MQQTLAKITINNAEDKKTYLCKIRVLDEHWKNALIILQNKVMASMVNQSLYIPLTEDEIDEVLSGKGVFIGAVVEDKLVGFFMASFHDQETIELGKASGIPEEELDQLVYIESSVVLPMVRGNGLLKKMIHECLVVLEKMNQFQHLIATVSPENIPSLKTTMDLGFKITHLSDIHGHYKRYVLYKNIPLKKPETKTWDGSLFDHPLKHGTVVLAQ